MFLLGGLVVIGLSCKKHLKVSHVGSRDIGVDFRFYVGRVYYLPYSLSYALRGSGSCSNMCHSVLRYEDV